jgi:flagellar biosynthesis protein FlhA
MDPGTVTKKVRGVATVEPAFGLPALWITESQKEAADMAGYTVVELPAVLATHLTEIVKRHAHSLVSRQDVKNLLDSVKENNAAVVEELIPGMLSLGDIHKVSSRPWPTSRRKTRTPKCLPNMSAMACPRRFAPCLRMNRASFRS